MSNDSTDIQLEGWLRKEKNKKGPRSLAFGTSITRFFRVEPIVGGSSGTNELALCYYKDDKSTNDPCGWYFLSDFLEVNDDTFGHRQDTFDKQIVLTHPSRVFHLQAENDIEHQKWLSGLSSLCKEAKLSKNGEKGYFCGAAGRDEVIKKDDGREIPRDKIKDQLKFLREVNSAVCDDVIESTEMIACVPEGPVQVSPEKHNAFETRGLHSPSHNNIALDLLDKKEGSPQEKQPGDHSSDDSPHINRSISSQPEGHATGGTSPQHLASAANHINALDEGPCSRVEVQDMDSVSEIMPSSCHDLHQEIKIAELQTYDHRNVCLQQGRHCETTHARLGREIMSVRHSEPKHMQEESSNKTTSTNCISLKLPCDHNESPADVHEEGALIGYDEMEGDHEFVHDKGGKKKRKTARDIALWEAQSKKMVPVISDKLEQRYPPAANYACDFLESDSDSEEEINFEQEKNCRLDCLRNDDPTNKSPLVVRNPHTHAKLHADAASTAMHLDIVTPTFAACSEKAPICQQLWGPLPDENFLTDDWDDDSIEDNSANDLRSNTYSNVISNAKRSKTLHNHLALCDGVQPDSNFLEDDWDA